jgi:hypothetical protein
MDDLETLFRTARSERPEPSGDLMARVLADAAALQPVPAALPAARRPPRAEAGGGGFLAGLAALFGGGGVLAGMGSAAAMALLVGFVQPAPVSALTAAWGGTTTTTAAYDLTSGFDALLAEE